ncbi:hypothetical protein VV11_018350, partial [Trichodesmium erythraeum 21-75]|nr:hypothetical protein [Trichodesmium erythraeum 21-75]
PMYEDYYTIKTFIDIINDQAIPPEEFPNLLNLVEQMPEDSEEIANQIDDWLREESRLEIQEAYRNQVRKLPEIEWRKLGFGGAKAPPGNENESTKELILNAIKKNTPEPKPEENSEKK